MRHQLSTMRLVGAALAAIAASGAAGSARAQNAGVASLGDNLAVEVRMLPAVITTGAAGPMWSGEALGPIPGSITLTLDRVGMPSNPLDPAWPLSARWQFTSKRPNGSFTAELYGSGRANGAMQLRGVITEGFRAGADVELIVERDGRGATLVIYPVRHQ